MRRRSKGKSVVLIAAMMRLAYLLNRPNYQTKKMIGLAQRFNSKFDWKMEMRNYGE